jgi:hypothetical protein
MLGAQTAKAAPEKRGLFFLAFISEAEHLRSIGGLKPRGFEAEFEADEK